MHGFSTRRSGVSQAYSLGSTLELNLGFTASDTQENVRENRRRFVEAISGSRGTPLITVHQVHSNRSVVAGAMIAEAAHIAVGPTCAHEADGLLTSQPGILLGIQTADCIPVLVADPVRRVVAAFHAGWRGTAQRVVELGVSQMQAEFGSRPADLIAAIGPGILPCCYCVGDDLLAEFESRFDYAAELFSSEQGSSGVSKLRLDLAEANRRQLLAAGLSSNLISTVGGCTGCQPDLYYSHRASGGRAGRMMSVIGIR